YVEQTQELTPAIINSVAADLELESQAFMMPTNDQFDEHRNRLASTEPARPVKIFGGTAERQVR
ncbi:MAG TPA: hypothetical protein VM865_01625, partial [Acidobacteriaceae bacterium]|nr:hypothetical protein [Acidobacteriaceae bacterium]